MPWQCVQGRRLSHRETRATGTATPSSIERGFRTLLGCRQSFIWCKVARWRACLAPWPGQWGHPASHQFFLLAKKHSNFEPYLTSGLWQTVSWAMSANFWPSELLEIRIWVRGLKKVLNIEKVCVLVLILKGSVETLKKLCVSVETSEITSTTLKILTISIEVSRTFRFPPPRRTERSFW
jgi:hypothetical protein